VRRHDAALFELEPADGDRIAGDEAARDGVVDLLAWNVDPAVMAHDVSGRRETGSRNTGLSAGATSVS
jgi:hypothetical protein